MCADRLRYLGQCALAADLYRVGPIPVATYIEQLQCGLVEGRSSQGLTITRLQLIARKLNFSLLIFLECDASFINHQSYRQ